MINQKIELTNRRFAVIDNIYADDEINKSLRLYSKPIDPKKHSGNLQIYLPFGSS
ncbi:hypothetical protein [Sphingobacterium hungaricum]